jgi:hypothetical protein
MTAPVSVCCTPLQLAVLLRWGPGVVGDGPWPRLVFRPTRAGKHPWHAVGWRRCCVTALVSRYLRLRRTTVDTCFTYSNR